MHDTAYISGRLFFEIYASSRHKRVLDVGAMNVNGTLRDHAPPNLEYLGVDLTPGSGVDVVLEDPNRLPFDNETFDLVVSTSVFEHCQFFWLIFIEMLRVLKTNGFLFINAPSNGAYHDYPYDNWRFYPDAGLALEAWGRRNSLKVTMIESGILGSIRDIWNDFVVVFQKSDRPQTTNRQAIVRAMENTRNIRTHEKDEVERFSQATEDLDRRRRSSMLISRLKEEIGKRDAEIARLRVALGNLAAPPHRP